MATGGLGENGRTPSPQKLNASLRLAIPAEAAGVSVVVATAFLQEAKAVSAEAEAAPEATAGAILKEVVAILEETEAARESMPAAPLVDAEVVLKEEEVAPESPAVAIPVEAEAAPREAVPEETKLGTMSGAEAASELVAEIAPKEAEAVPQPLMMAISVESVPLSDTSPPALDDRCGAIQRDQVGRHPLSEGYCQGTAVPAPFCCVDCSLFTP